MMSPSPTPLAAPGRGVRATPALALALFVVLGFWQSESFMVWSEETMVHSVPAPVVLSATPGEDGTPRREPSCADAHTPLFVLSDGRPRLTLCAAGRSWPVMIAPYFAGYFYWPFTVFAGLHHDNVLLLRKLGLLLGAASILLTYRVVKRLAGPRIAALGALSTAVAPCFVVIHAILVHFETLPWCFLMLALLAFAGCPGLVPTRTPAAPPAGDDGFPIWRLAAGGFMTGCALIANLKTGVLIAPLFFVAHRLRIPVFRPGIRRWLVVMAAALVPLIPLIALAFAPVGGYGDKSSGWQHTLLAHLTQPQRILPNARDLILLWSNVPFYFSPVTGTTAFNHAAAAVATAAACFVVIDAARTLHRREGCALTAGLGACLVAYLVMVTLLYEDFPANFTPLHTIYALSIAVAVARLAERLSRGGAWPWAAVPIAILALGPFAWNVAQSERAFADARIPTNVRTELALVDYLLEHIEPGTVNVTVDSQLLGVVDSLSNGSVRTTQAESYLRACRPYKGNPDAQACLHERWQRLLPFVGAGVIRVIMPESFAAWGSRHIDITPTLERAAAAAGYTLSLERSFPAPHGAPGIVVYRAVPGPSPAR